MYGIRIKELRERENLTQKDLGKKINSTQKQISKWETEFIEPNIFWLITLARFFNVTVDYIVGNEESEGEGAKTIKNSFNNFKNTGNFNIK